ncbi:MAG: hypothetical protein KDB22_29690 [Planctomycetales bacterium]|nr:hypothetical protein [Planctomycetales bacterium]
MTQSSELPRKNKSNLNVLAAILVAMAALLLTPVFFKGCFTKQQRDKTKAQVQIIEESKAKTDNLRKAMRFLNQLTPVTRENYIKEVQLELNTWLKGLDQSGAEFSPPRLLRDFPQDLLVAVECENPLSLRFGYWDVDYLFEQCLMNDLSAWITQFDLRDNLIAPMVKAHQEQLSPADGMKLEEACKLFDWTIRNVAMDGATSSVDQLSDNPSQLGNGTLGCNYLPWECLLFSAADFVERGRVFSALATQRGIDTCWIATKPSEGPGKLWAVGALIGEQIYVFEPKLGIPVLDPDKPALATLQDALKNERVLRRLDLPGQFEYALDQEQIQSFQFLVDAPPSSATARMKILQESLLGAERMVTYRDVDALANRLTGLFPEAPVSLWLVPALAQVNAAEVREMLRTTNPNAMRYLAMHGVWLSENPAANGRILHLKGQFENTDDGQGALTMYIETRIDNERLEKIMYDPDVQREFGIVRPVTDTDEQFEARLRQAQMIFGRAKIDASFLLAELHYDRGNYSESMAFITRVLNDDRAAYWHNGCYYLLGRIYQEQDELAKATEALTRPMPQEPGNRLRLRYLQRESAK